MKTNLLLFLAVMAASSLMAKPYARIEAGRIQAKESSATYNGMQSQVGYQRGNYRSGAFGYQFHWGGGRVNTEIAVEQAKFKVNRLNIGGMPQKAGYEVEQWSGMANATYEHGNGRVRPYAGFGVGASGATQIVPAGQVIAGVKVKTGKRGELTFGATKRATRSADYDGLKVDKPQATMIGVGYQFPW